MTLDREVELHERIAKQLDKPRTQTVQEARRDRIIVQAQDTPLYVALHHATSTNGGMTKKDLNNLNEENAEAGLRTAHIFRRDGENFYVPLRFSELKGKDEKSLKNYRRDQKNRMIHLRDLEKEVLRDMNLNGDNTLTYFNEDGIEVFEMGEVVLDRNHLPREEIENYDIRLKERSRNYRLPVRKTKAEEDEKLRAVPIGEDLGKVTSQVLYFLDDYNQA